MDAKDFAEPKVITLDNWAEFKAVIATVKENMNSTVVPVIILDSLSTCFDTNLTSKGGRE